MIRTIEELDALLASLNDDLLTEFGRRVRQAYEAEHAPHLQRMDLFVTQRCNLRCDYCFLDGSERQHDMPLEVAEAAIKLALKLSRERDELQITLFGGEPLLCLDRMEEILHAASQLCREQGKKLQVSCTTNGLLLDERAIELSQKYGFLYLLSIDGLPEVHDRHRKAASGEGTFSKLAERLEFFRRHQPWRGARMSVAPDGIASLAAGVRYLFDLGFQQFVFGLVTEAEWSEEELARIKEQYYQLFCFALTTRRNGTPLKLSLLEREAFNPEAKRHVGCSAGTQGISVDVEGNILPCARFLRRSSFCLGHVTGQDFQWGIGGWFMDPRPELRWKCLPCEYRDYCTGGCPESNLAATGSYYCPSEAFCAETKAIVELMREHPEFRELGDQEAPASAD